MVAFIRVQKRVWARIWNCKMLFQVSGCGRGLCSHWHGNGLVAKAVLESSELPILHPGCLFTAGMWNRSESTWKWKAVDFRIYFGTESKRCLWNTERLMLQHRWWWKKQQDISGYLWTLGASKHVYLISTQCCVSRIVGGCRNLLQGSACQILERFIATWTQQLWSEGCNCSPVGFRLTLGSLMRCSSVCSWGTVCWGAPQPSDLGGCPGGRYLLCSTCTSACEDAFCGAAHAVTRITPFLCGLKCLEMLCL